MAWHLAGNWVIQHEQHDGSDCDHTCHFRACCHCTIPEKEENESKVNKNKNKEKMDRKNKSKKENRIEKIRVKTQTQEKVMSLFYMTWLYYW